MLPSFSTWRTEVPCKVSGELPIIYQTKITKTKVIPLYRLANPKGETQDVIVFMTDSYDEKKLEYTKKEVYPILSLIPVEEGKLSHSQIALDMLHNCNALGIEVQDGIKEDGWKQFEPTIALPSTIPIDDLSKYYQKEEVVSLPDVTTSIENRENREKTRIENPSEVLVTEEVAEGKDEKVRVIVGGSMKSDNPNEPSYHLEAQPKGKRGRPRKVYDDPVYDALIRSIPHSVPCKGCGKDIIIVPLNIIDRAKALGVEVKELVSNYKCRSCK